MGDYILGEEIASVDAVARLARMAARRIATGALDDGGVNALAAEFGISARHLRRAIHREFGATPTELATTHRLLTAKHLLTETQLPVTTVAYTSGFGSVRRFNTAFKARYRLTPSDVRGSSRRNAERGGSHGETVTLSLAYRPPYDWVAIRDYLATRCTPGVDAVMSERYWRNVQIDHHQGFLSVGPCAQDGQHPGLTGPRQVLELELSLTLLPVLSLLIHRVRHLFDLDSDPETVRADLGSHPMLTALVTRRPGLRVPGAIDVFDLAIRTIIGQQTSLRRGQQLAGAVANLIGEPVSRGGYPEAVRLTRLPVTAERLADAPVVLLASSGLSGTRIAACLRLANLVAAGELPELTNRISPVDPSVLLQRLATLPGVGIGTATCIVMRALHWPDAFPENDVLLRKAAGDLSPARLRSIAESWRPWRAYAAMHLWTSATL